MPYSSVWMRAPFATVASMIGWIVVCCTLANMSRTTWPRRWMRPRMGGLSFSSVRPAPARRPACGGVRAAPFDNSGGLTLVPGHDVDLVDLHLALERHLPGPCDQADAQLLRHDLHVRPTE